MNYKKIPLFLTLLMTVLSLHSQTMADVQIETVKLSENVYMLLGRGGNMGVSIGEDGVFIIDDQFAPLTSKHLEAIKKLSDGPIQYLVNTHWHGDHTGGNENMAKAGATIMAHDNVRKRLAETPNRQNELAPEEALPVITYDSQMTVYMNGEPVAIYHVDNAHTDGDSIIYFAESNVMHTGDTYFHARYPYIDLNSGGSVDGYISAVERSLMLIDDETKIIPGHGPVSNKKEYAAFLEMMIGLRTNVIAAIKNGKTEDEVATDESITKTYDDLGYAWNFITSERIRRTFYKSLKN